MTEFKTSVGKRSKEAGKRGERRTAELFVKFTGRNFRRTPSSGGWNKQGLIVAEYAFNGDLMCDDPKFLFSVENKNAYRSLSFAQLIANPESSVFTEWWCQTLLDSRTVSKLPMLVFRLAGSSSQNVAAECVALNLDGIKMIEYPDNSPKIVMDLYHKEMTVVIRKKEHVMTPDNPVYVINWRNIEKFVNKEKLFRAV